MFSYLEFIIVSFLFNSLRAQDTDFISNGLSSQSPQEVWPNSADLYFMQDKLLFQGLLQQEKVKVQLFYECLCPDCRQFDVQQFAPTVRKLSNYLDIYLYPYGNAQTTIYPNGTVEFRCQHGPAECYGNMLHACAINHLNNITQTIDFNSCMMDSSQSNRGSDNEAAEKCGKQMNIDIQPIKACANGQQGQMLLKKYGEESKKVGFQYVPYILINGVANDGDNFLRDVCAAFTNPPPECNA